MQVVRQLVELANTMSEADREFLCEIIGPNQYRRTARLCEHTERTREELGALEERARGGVAAKADHLLQRHAGGLEGGVVMDLVPELRGDAERHRRERR